MGKREKLLARIRNNVKGVRFEDLNKVLEWTGFRLKRVSGSHHVYVRGNRIVVVARRKPHVSPAAVKEVLGILDELVDDE